MDVFMDDISFSMKSCHQWWFSASDVYGYFIRKYNLYSLLPIKQMGQHEGVQSRAERIQALKDHYLLPKRANLW